MGTIEKEIHQKKFSSDYHRMVLNIIYTANWLGSQHAQRLKKYEITPEQFNILRILRGQHPSPATINLLIERMLDKMSNASRLVDKLKTKGFVERKICKNDRRAVDVLITGKGLSLLKQIDKNESPEKWEKTYSNLTKKEAKLVSDLLNKLRG